MSNSKNSCSRRVQRNGGIRKSVGLSWTGAGRYYTADADTGLGTDGIA